MLGVLLTVTLNCQSLICIAWTEERGFPGGSLVKNLPAAAEDMGLIPGLGRSPREGIGNHFSILAWRIPWTEEPDGLQSLGVTKSQTWFGDWACMHAQTEERCLAQRNQHMEMKTFPLCPNSANSEVITPWRVSCASIEMAWQSSFFFLGYWSLEYPLIIFLNANHLRVCFPGNPACNSEFENCDGIDTSAEVVWESGIWKEYNDNLGFVFFEFMWKWLDLDCQFFVNLLLLNHQPLNSACHIVDRSFNKQTIKDLRLEYGWQLMEVRANALKIDNLSNWKTGKIRTIENWEAVYKRESAGYGARMLLFVWWEVAGEQLGARIVVVDIWKVMWI